jgi:hypothetical protein
MGLSEHSTYQFPLSLMSCIYTHILAFIKEGKVVRMGVLETVAVCLYHIINTHCPSESALYSLMH